MDIPEPLWSLSWKQWIREVEGAREYILFDPHFLVTHVRVRAREVKGLAQRHTARWREPHTSERKSGSVVSWGSLRG